MKFGPFAVAPMKITQPVAAETVARLLAAMVEQGSAAPAGVEVEGPERINLAKLARRICLDNVATGNGRAHAWVIGVRVPGMKVRNGGLLPAAEVLKDPTTFEQWMGNARRG